MHSFLPIRALTACGVFACTLTGFAREKLDLAGKWRVALDRSNVGEAEGWASKELGEPIDLPGNLADAGFGDELSTATEWVSGLHDPLWYLRGEFKKYAKAGDFKSPYWLVPPRKYAGAAWYQRSVTIPEGWRGKRVEASFERAHWSTMLYLDGKKAGELDTLGAPHIYDLGIVEPGEHKLSVRVDNSFKTPERPAVRYDAHSISDHTQTNWNGLAGDLKLTATSPVYIAEARVFPAIADKTARVEVTVGNAGGAAGSGTIWANGISAPIQWTADGGKGEVIASFGADAALWDEFDPKLHDLKIELKGEGADDVRELKVGLREARVAGTDFLMNGRKTFFRGTMDGAAFPLTTTPPTDVESWRRIMKICKSYGLNHIRFHSWCPPEAAFAAADEVGMYLGPEASNWGNYGDEKMVAFLDRETAAILKAFGNHPSFVLFAAGNEAGGPWQGPLIAWIAKYRAFDARHLYTPQTGWPFSNEGGAVEGMDFIAAMRTGGGAAVRGNAQWFGGDYRASLQGVNVPVISHEIGQYVAFPDVADEMPKYTGALKPGNLEIIADKLKEHGLLEQAKAFTLASGAWQVACYKEEIEQLLRTPGLGGFQLLDLHDFPGQGTAPVGPLNVFWESKGYVTPEEYRKFCAPIVPLARMGKLVWTTAETMQIPVEIANFSAGSIENAEPKWKIVDDAGKTVVEGAFERKTIPVGNGIALGTVAASLEKVAAPAKLRLVVELAGTEGALNDWEFWVFPTGGETAAPGAVLIASKLDDVLARLAQGGKVLWTVPSDMLSWDSVPYSRSPIFWNRLMGPRWERTVGMVIQKDHAALAEFPTEGFYDWQWQDVVVPYRRAINLDRLPAGLKPIVQPIDEWFRNYKLGMLFEAKVGAGKLMVASMDLTSQIDQRPAARQLRKSILDYMASERFNPEFELKSEDLNGFVFDNFQMAKLGAQVVGEPAAAGRGRRGGRGGAPGLNAAIDGNVDSAWSRGGGGGRGRRGAPAAEPEGPNSITIAFPQAVMFSGLRVMNMQTYAAGRTRSGDVREYTVETSPDGEAWSQAAKGELQSTWEPQTIAFGKTVTARRLRLTSLSGFGADRSMSLAEIVLVYEGPKLPEDIPAPPAAAPGPAPSNTTDLNETGLAPVAAPGGPAAAN